MAEAPIYPPWTLGLMNTAPGSIDRRFPKWWDDAEGGIDWNAPIGTPVTALADGYITGAGYFCKAAGTYNMTSDAGACGHGVVTTNVTNQDGSVTALYYQHIILNSAIMPCWNGQCGGQTVKQGQVIGYISDFGMLEVGVNTPWGGIWGPNPKPGPHVDPEPYLRALIMGRNTTGTISGTGLPGVGIGGVAGTYGLPTGLLNWLSDPVRIFKMLAGVTLIFLALYMLVVPGVETKVGSFIKKKSGFLAV